MKGYAYETDNFSDQSFKPPIRGLPVKTPTHMCIVLLLAHVLAKKRRVHLEISHTRYQLKKFIISTKLFS
ncbi:hypothetical protein GCM10026988_26760 [Vibrio panuliri]